MKRCLHFFLFLIFCFGSHSAQICIRLLKDTAFFYAYADGDEFNGPLDEHLWKNGLGGRRVLMAQDLAFAPDLVRESNGSVEFLAVKRDSLYELWDWEVDSNFLRKSGIQFSERKWLTRYSAGGIVSRRKYHYGLYELRFKVEAGQGVWPAFWFYGGRLNEEIDVFELKGERLREIHVDTHCPSGCAHGYRKGPLSLPAGYGGWMPLSGALSQGWNIAFLLWEKDRLIWYLNGIPMAYYRGKFSHPMNLFLNNSVAKKGEAFEPGPGPDTKWPNVFKVDFLRHYADTGQLLLWRGRSRISGDSLSMISGAFPLKKSGTNYKKSTLRLENGLIEISMPVKDSLLINMLGLKDTMGMLEIRFGDRSELVKFSLQNELTIYCPMDLRSLELTLNFRRRTYHRLLWINK